MMYPHTTSRIENAIWSLQPVTIAHGESVIVTEQPLVTFRPHRFIVDPVCAPFYIVNDMMFGNNIIFDNPVAATCFPPLPPKFSEMCEEDKAAIQTYLNKITFPTVTPANRIRLIVQHRGMCPWHFECNRVEGMKPCQAPPFSAFFQGISQTF